MSANLKPKFFQLIDSAIYTDSTQVIKNLYTIREYVTDDLEIIYTNDIEVLEFIVRTLAVLDLELVGKVFEGKFKVINCPIEQVEFVTWFVQFFALLESSQYPRFKYNLYHASIFNQDYAPNGLDYNQLEYGYWELKVEFEERILS